MGVIGFRRGQKVGPPCSDQCPYKKRKRAELSLHLTCEDAMHRRPSLGQEESPHYKPAMLVP